MYVVVLLSRFLVDGFHCDLCCSSLSKTAVCLQCFDAGGWAAGRASSLQKTEWWGVGVVVCLEQGADLHMAQLMPLPVTVSCFSKVQIGFTLLLLSYLGRPGKRATKQVCVLKSNSIKGLGKCWGL